MIEQDGAVLLFGEISSASSLTIMQVAERNKKVFFSTGARSDALRGKDCNRYSFHCDIPNTVMVNAVGTALNQKGMVKGKKFVTLTADYIFGHDLLKAAKAFFSANDATLIGDELIATDVTDFSPYLLKVRQAKPDVVCCNLAGNQLPMEYMLNVYTTNCWPYAHSGTVPSSPRTAHRRSHTGFPSSTSRRPAGCRVACDAPSAPAQHPGERLPSLQRSQ